MIFSSTLLALVSASPEPPADVETPPTISIEVDVSALPAEDPVTQHVKDLMAQHEAKAIEDGGIVVEPQGAYALTTVVSRFGTRDIHYRATFTLTEDGAEEPTHTRTRECRACTDTELYEMAGYEAARLTAGLVLAAPPPPSVVECPVATDRDHETSEGDAAEVDRNHPSTDHEPGKTRRLGPLGHIGIGVAVGGAGLLAAGVPIAFATTTFGRDTEGFVTQTNARPVGVSVAVSGSVLLAAGATMLIIDAVRRKRERATPVVLAPFVSPRRAGLTAALKF